MIRETSGVGGRRRVAGADGAGSRGWPGDDKHRRPVIDRGRAVCGPWYHPGSSRPHGARPWLHGDDGMWVMRIARCIDAVTGVACSVGSTRRRLLRGRWGTTAGFGARLEGLVRWRSGSRFAADAVLLLVPARYSSLSSPVDVSVVACILPVGLGIVKRGERVRPAR
jgi:hypothetical protein